MSRPETAKLSRSRNYAPLIWLAVIAVVAIVLYVPSPRGEFVLDDNELIVTNPAAHGISHFTDAFGTYFLHGFVGAEKLYYRPLITVSYQLDYMLAGLDPQAFRFTNLLLYIGVAMLVFALARKLTRSTLIAGIAGLAFVVLPSHAESVAWISGRTDILASLFMLGSLLAFVSDYSTESGFSWFKAALCALLLCCALFSKETAVVLPVLFVLYAWIYGEKPKRADVLKWAAVLVPVVIFYLCMRRWALGTTLDAHMSYMLKARLLKVGIIYAQYLRMLFIPGELRLDYDSFPLRTLTASPVVLAAWIAPICLITACVYARKRLPVVSFCAGWIFINLLPVADILSTHGRVPAERFVYFASIGSAILLGWLFIRAWEWRPNSINIWPVVVVILAGSYGLYSSALAVQGVQVYQTNISWSRYVAATQPKWWMHHATAAQFFTRAGLLKEAAGEYESAMKYGWVSGDEKADAAFKLGLLYVTLGDMNGAARVYSQAVEARPSYGQAWRNLGRADLILGRYSDAVKAYERAGKLGALNQRDMGDLARARAQSK